LETIQTTIDQESFAELESAGATYIECFRGTNLRRTRIIVLATLLQHFLGTALLSNANYFLIMSGMSPSKSLQISQIGIGLQIFATYISWFTMSWLGRRFLILASTAAVGVFFIAMGVAGFYQSDPKALTYVDCLIFHNVTIARPSN
jgi:SP family general alpha glucoside:H+ symporter-like MFS transporter